MARMLNRLSDVSVRAKKRPGYTADGGNLYLRVAPSGSRSWIFRFAMGGKTRDAGLGSYPTISLVKAREEAERCRRLVAAGIDPIQARNQHRGREEERRRLYEVVDAILDDPDPKDPDRWVRQTLVGIGLVIRAAHLAFHYEIGRVISGADRPRGDFPSNASWVGAAIRVDLDQVAKWIAAGEAALDERLPSVETEQRALAAVLRPIAAIALHAWLHDLADGLDALSFGEVQPIMARSARGLAGMRKGRTAWQLRLSALRWVEFQVAARKIKTKTEAYEVVATQFERTSQVVQEWRKDAATALGSAFVREALDISRRLGEFFRRQVASATADDKYRDYLKDLETTYSESGLKGLAKLFKELPSKKHGIGK